MSGLRVLHCLNHFLPGQPAGTEVYTWALCKALEKQGFTSSVAIPNYEKDIAEEYEYDGLRVFKFAETSVISKKLQMGLEAPNGVIAFRSLLQQEQPDIVHFHELAGSNGFTVHHVEAAKALTMKTVVSFHLANASCKAGTLMYRGKKHCDGVIRKFRCSNCILSTDFPGLVGYSSAVVALALKNINVDLSGKESKVATALSFPFIISRLKNKLTLLSANADALVCIADWYKEVLLRNHIEAGKITVIRQGLADAGAFMPASEKKYSPTLRLVFIGRVSYLKGLHLIIKAMAVLPAEKISLDIYGPGTEDDYAAECKQASAAMKNIHWKGMLQPGQAVQVIQQYDALILASLFSEMSPLVIQEAFQAGRPVIASNVYGNAEQIVAGKNGWLFNFNDAESLTTLLTGLIHQPQRYAPENLEIKAPRKFDQLAAEYAAVYKTITDPIAGAEGVAVLPE
ncbi:MAG: glycosyltransferase [Ferruginibacter sp.]|nr:glycosyltransferase [Ferruginibacter sp.]